MSEPGADVRPAPTVSPFELLEIVWRRKLVVAIVLVLSIAAAVALSLRSSDEYSATAKLLFRDPGFARTLFGNDLFEPGQDQQRTTQTNVDVVSSRSVALQARTLLHTDESVDSLMRSIEVSPSADSDVVDIKATRSSPESAAAVANAFASGYVAYRRKTDRAAVGDAERLVEDSLATASPAEKPRLQDSLRQLGVLQALQTGNAELIAAAQPDDQRVSPQPKRDALLGAIVGLVLGCGLALLVDLLDRRLKSSGELERAYGGYPIIASVPRGAHPDPLAPQLTGRAGEAYRMLREGLRFLDPNGLARCFVITSAEESEGKSTVAVNLASSLATVGQRVILIEADMRRPTAAAQLGIGPTAPGLSNVLVSDADTDEHLVDVFGDRLLRVLPAGSIPPNPADLLRAGRLVDVISVARESADIVLIDAPPLLPVSDTRVLLQLPQIDGVIMVGRVGTSRRDHAREARRVLEQSGRRVFGLVVTDVAEGVGSSYYDSPSDYQRPRGRRGRKVRSAA